MVQMKLNHYISYYAPRGAAYGHQQLNDAIIKDGLWDAYNNIHMVHNKRTIKDTWDSFKL